MGPEKDYAKLGDLQLECTVEGWGHCERFDGTVGALMGSEATVFGFLRH